MQPTPAHGVRAARALADIPNRPTHELPSHLAGWQLPPDWRWGGEGVQAHYRHYQEVVDALGRSLSLVSVTDPAHAGWLAKEARYLAHRDHPSIPTAYHYWTANSDARRGPGYLRHWIAGETVGARVRRTGPQVVPYTLQVLRAAGSTLAYLHDAGQTHGALGPEIVYVTPDGRIWLLGWQWAMPRADVPPGLMPHRRWSPWAPEWLADGWSPTPASDQWQLGATCFAALTGELPPSKDIPPLRFVVPECPQSVADIVDRALAESPEERHRSVASLLRQLERIAPTRTVIVSGGIDARSGIDQSEEARLRWATGDDYEVLAKIGRGSFGSVWRVRDLSLGREVALKMLHPHVAQDLSAVERFRREARLAAQLAHPAIVPIYDWDSRGDVAWYTMELAEGGSVADLIEGAGPRSVAEVAPQIDAVLDALAAAHSIGVLHRDLKPENVLIDRYRRCRLTDFGIAEVVGETRGGATGTPAFAAPEQLLGEAQGPAVDCFAIAAIVYYVLVGHAPFVGNDGPSVLAQQLAGHVDLAGFDPAIAAWLRRGLEPDADRRFADATEMQAAWRQVTAPSRGDTPISSAAVVASPARGTWWSRVVRRVR